MAQEKHLDQMDNVTLMETVKQMKDELDRLRAEKKAAERLREMEELAEKKAEEVAEAEKREKELQDEFFEKMFQEKLEQKRREKKIEFPVGLRAGNLSKTDKQLVDIIMGRKSLQFDAYGVKATLTTTNAVEWNTQELANEILRAKEELTRVRGALRVINMTSNPFRVPLRTGPADVSAPGENNPIPENNTDFVDDITLTASKLAAHVPITTEEGEDAIIAVLPEIRSAMYEGLSVAEDEFFLNGTINRGATPVSGTGITGKAGVVKTAGAAGTAATVADFDKAISDALRAMGRYGIDPSELVFFVGYNTYFALLYNNDKLQTMSQIGDRAVLLTGQVGVYKGLPVLVTSGVLATNETGTVMEKNLIVNKRAVLLGDRRTLTIKSQEDIISDKIHLVGTQRNAYEVPYTQGVAQVVTHVAQ